MMATISFEIRCLNFASHFQDPFAAVVVAVVVVAVVVAVVAAEPRKKGF